MKSKLKNVKIGWSGIGRWGLINFSNLKGNYYIDREKTLYLPFYTIYGKINIELYQHKNK